MRAGDLVDRNLNDIEAQLRGEWDRLESVRQTLKESWKDTARNIERVYDGQLEQVTSTSHERERARLGVSGYEMMLARHAGAAGIARPASPHRLRHACATHLLRGGADVREVQELLGHASINTTTLYTRVETSDLREVLRRSHPRERRKPRAMRGRIRTR